MATIRKVSPAIAATWAPAPAASRRLDDRYDWAARPARLFLQGGPRTLVEPPRVCDVLRLRAPAEMPAERTTGVVVGVRVRSDGVWTHAQLAVGGEVKWVSKSTIAAHLGRAKGLTRVDQPTKQIGERVHGGTHAWFVRVYDGKLPKCAKTFSDRAAGGMLEALRAALAFHAANVGLDEAEGIAFL